MIEIYIELSKFPIDDDVVKRNIFEYCTKKKDSGMVLGNLPF